MEAPHKRVLPLSSGVMTHEALARSGPPPSTDPSLSSLPSQYPARPFARTPLTLALLGWPKARVACQPVFAPTWVPVAQKPLPLWAQGGSASLHTSRGSGQWGGFEGFIYSLTACFLGQGGGDWRQPAHRQGGKGIVTEKVHQYDSQPRLQLICYQ